MVLVTDGDKSFVFFSYLDIQLGGANIGFNSGNNHYMIPGALSADTQDIETTSNVGVAGLYVFRVDQEDIIHPTLCTEAEDRSGYGSGGGIIYAGSGSGLVDVMCGSLEAYLNGKAN